MEWSDVVTAAADASEGRRRHVRADASAVARRCSRAASPHARSAHAERAPGAGRAVPLSLRHGQVHRLQVLRRRLQRAERQSGRRSTGGASARSKAAGSRTPTRSYLSMGCNHCLEPTCLEGCPVDAYIEGSGHRHRAPQRRRLHRLPVPARGTAPTACRSTTPSAASSASATCATAAWRSGQTPACVSACPEGAIAIEIVNVADWRRSRSPPAPPTPGLPEGDGSLSTTRVTLPTTLPPNARPRGHHARRARASALAARRDDRADAVVGRRLRHDLAVAAVRRDRPISGSRAIASLLVGGLALVGIDAAPRSSDSRLSRVADVAALVAEPRGAAVLGVLRRGRRPMPAMLWFGMPGGGCIGALTVAARHRRRDGERLHLPRAVAAGVEHALHAPAVQPDRRRARAAVCRGRRRRRPPLAGARPRRRWRRAVRAAGAAVVPAALPPTVSSCAARRGCSPPCSRDGSCCAACCSRSAPSCFRCSPPAAAPDTDAPTGSWPVPL